MLSQRETCVFCSTRDASKYILINILTLTVGLESIAAYRVLFYPHAAFAFPASNFFFTSFFIFLQP